MTPCELLLVNWRGVPTLRKLHFETILASGFGVFDHSWWFGISCNYSKDSSSCCGNCRWTSNRDWQSFALPWQHWVVENNNFKMIGGIRVYKGASICINLQGQESHTCIPIVPAPIFFNETNLKALPGVAFARPSQKKWLDIFQGSLVDGFSDDGNDKDLHWKPMDRLRWLPKDSKTMTPATRTIISHCKSNQNNFKDLLPFSWQTLVDSRAGASVKTVVERTCTRESGRKRFKNR